MEQVGAFVLEQLLKMQWLSTLFENLLVLFGVEVSTPIGASLHFFLYDTVKIVILLTMMIFAIGYVQTYFPPERSRKIMGRFKGLPGNIVGALLGTVTPFCSCSSIPIFIGFTRAGLPLGVTFSFLISSPMVDVGSLVLVMSIFGPSIAAIYTVVGLVIAVAGGTLIQRLSMEDQIEEFVYGEAEVETGISSLAISERISQAWAETSGTFRKVFPYILVGVGVGALIHNWIPQEAIEFFLGEGNPLAVIIATLIGVPIYADIFGTIPIAEALYFKGVGLGTVLALMMSVTTLSLPSITMLSRVIKPKLMVVFIGVCVFGMALSGYLFNMLQPLFV